MGSWSKIQLGNACHISKGQQLNKVDLEKAGDYPCINGGIEPSGYTDKWNTEANTITISEGGNSCGFVNFITTRFWSGGHCYSLLDINEKIDMGFLYQALKGRENLIMSLRVGSGLPNIQQKAIKEFEFNYPESKPEQYHITRILSKADEAISQTEALIAKYQRIKTGLMQDLLTKGIDEHGNIRSKATHKFEIKNGIEVPEEWEVVDLEKVCLKIADRDHTTPRYTQDGIYMVSPKDFNVLDEIDFSECQKIPIEDHLINRRKTNIEYNDLIFTRIGAGLGKICKVTKEMPEFSILHSACMIKPNHDKINSDFLLYFFKSEFAQKQIADGIQSIGVPDLGMDKIRSFYVKKPLALEEQNEIANILTSQDNLIRNERKRLNKLISIKSGLMQDLLNGRVRVRVDN